jgi:hypothetical protein
LVDKILGGMHIEKLTKALALILALIMLLSFAACNGLSDGETTEEATTALAGTVAIPRIRLRSASCTSPAKTILRLHLRASFRFS